MNQVWETTLLHKKLWVKASRTWEGFCNCSQTPRKDLGIRRGLRWYHHQWARGKSPGMGGLPVPAWTEAGGLRQQGVGRTPFHQSWAPMPVPDFWAPQGWGGWTLLVAPHGQHWASCVSMVFPQVPPWESRDWLWARRIDHLWYCQHRTKV